MGKVWRAHHTALKRDDALKAARTARLGYRTATFRNDTEGCVKPRPCESLPIAGGRRCPDSCRGKRRLQLDPRPQPSHRPVQTQLSARCHWPARRLSMPVVARLDSRLRHNRSAGGRPRVPRIGSPGWPLLPDKATATWSFESRPTMDHRCARVRSSSTIAACACRNARHAATRSGLQIKA